MKFAKYFRGEAIRKRLKAKAHAMTMAAGVWLFFSLMGIALIIVGILDWVYVERHGGSAIQAVCLNRKQGQSVTGPGPVKDRSYLHSTINENTTISVGVRAPRKRPSGDTPSGK